MKPLFVEFLGPSGVGKSTLYKSVQDQWSLNKQWVTFDHIYSREKRFPFSHLKSINKSLRRLNRSTFDCHNSDRNYRIWEWMNSYSSKFLYSDDRSFHTSLLDLVQKHTSMNYNGEDKRFETIYMMMWSMAQYHSIIELENDNRIFLMKEGELFLSRIMHFVTPSFNETALDEFLNMIPMPIGVIYLNAEPELIVERVNNRDRVSSIHMGMNRETLHLYTEKAIKIMNMAIEKIKKRGVAVLEVDATVPIINRTEATIQFLEKCIQEKENLTK